MTSHIARDFRYEESVDLTDSVATTPVIEFRPHSRGMIFIPSGSSITTLTFHAAPHPGGTFEPLKDSSNNAVTLTVAADGAYALPDDCFAAGALKIEVNADGSVSLCFKG